MTEKISKADKELFRDAVGEVRPVKESGKVDPRPKPDPEPRMTEAGERAVLDELLARDPDPEKMESGEELSFLRPGLQTRILRRLRRGRYSIGAELDLHHLTLDEAKREIVLFLADARERRVRCVRIIHGKGRRSPNRMPALKRLVNGLLRRRSEVLAFTSAPREDGGTGVVYVLLQK